MIFLYIALGILFVAIIVLFILLIDARSDLAMNQADNEIAIDRLTKSIIDNNWAQMEQIEELAAKTPRYNINKKNEAILTLADGKTEIFNYQLIKK